MNDNTRNTYASYALEILKRGVLEVLYQQQKDAEELGGNPLYGQRTFANDLTYRGVVR